VLVFNLPEMTFAGNLNVLDPGGVNDLRIDPNGSDVACVFTTVGAVSCATKMIFYSLDTGIAPADVGLLRSVQIFRSYQRTQTASSRTLPPP
jgi:hypothetical protein